MATASNPPAASGNASGTQNRNTQKFQKKPTPCKWAGNCKNNQDQHFIDFSHPKSHPKAKSITPEGGSQELCKFDEAGTCRYLNDPSHLARYAHPVSLARAKPQPQVESAEPKQDGGFPALHEAANMKKPKQDQFNGKPNQQGRPNQQWTPVPGSNAPPHYPRFQPGTTPHFQPLNPANFTPPGQQFHPLHPGAFSQYPSASAFPADPSGFGQRPFAFTPDGYHFYPSPYDTGFYGGEEEDLTDDDEFYLDEETEKHYDKFVEGLGQGGNEPKDVEFEKDWQEFLREQGCDVDGDSEDEYYTPEQHYMQQKFEQVRISNPPQVFKK